MMENCINEISIFIPIYNSVELLKNVKNIEFLIKKLRLNYEIFLIDDNSKDNTVKEIKRIYGKNNKIKLIKFDEGPSRRENLGKAMPMANFSTLIFFDIDILLNKNDLVQIINSIKDFDIAIGSRYVEGAKTKRFFLRYLISKIYNNTLKILFNSKIKDHQCGFKAFKKNILLELLNEMGYDNTFKRGWFWDAELLIRAQKHNLKIKEIPISWEEGKVSSFDFKKELKMIPHILKFFTKQF